MRKVCNLQQNFRKLCRNAVYPAAKHLCKPMNITRNTSLAVLVGALAALLSACSTEPRQKPIEGASDYVRQENQPDFSVPAQYASMKNNVVRIDINRDGYDDAVVTVLAAPVPDTQAAFDSVFVYEYVQNSDSFERKYGSAVFYGTSVEMLDMDADEHPEVLVYTDAGGNDPIVSKGMMLVRFRDASYRNILQLDGGNPELTTLNEGGSALPVVKVFSDFWPDLLSHAESVHFLDSIIIVKNVSDSVRAGIERSLFGQALEEAERDYARAKNAYAERQDDEAAYSVYNAAVRAVKYYRKLDKPEKINAFRSQEWKFWRGVMSEENVNVLNQLAAPGSSS